MRLFNFVAAAAVAAALINVCGIARAGEPPVIAVSLKDNVFSPAEIRVPKDTAFVLKVSNLETAAAEIESKRLHIEKVVVPGGDISVTVKPQPAGRYLLVNEYHEDVAKAWIIAE